MFRTVLTNHVRSDVSSEACNGHVENDAPTCKILPPCNPIGVGPTFRLCETGFTLIVVMPVCVQNPGPGTYRDVSTNVYKSREPTYTMLTRNFLPDVKLRIPGPGAHSPERVS